MSVTTRADELRREAQEKVKEAVRAVNELYYALIINPEDVWGAGDFTKEYKNDLIDVQAELAKLKEKL